jgi:hypothetical protein
MKAPVAIGCGTASCFGTVRGRQHEEDVFSTRPAAVATTRTSAGLARRISSSRSSVPGSPTLFAVASEGMPALLENPGAPCPRRQRWPLRRLARGSAGPGLDRDDCRGSGAPLDPGGLAGPEAIAGGLGVGEGDGGELSLAFGGRGSSADWSFAFGTVDYRIQGSISSQGTAFRWHYEVAKYYDFENPIFGYGGKQVSEMQAQGFGQNFWVIGYSSWPTSLAPGS